MVFDGTLASGGALSKSSPPGFQTEVVPLVIKMFHSYMKCFGAVSEHCGVKVNKSSIPTRVVFMNNRRSRYSFIIHLKSRLFIQTYSWANTVYRLNSCGLTYGLTWSMYVSILFVGNLGKPSTAIVPFTILRINRRYTYMTGTIGWLLEKIYENIWNENVVI